MIVRRAILKVNNSEYDILRFNHKFQRDIDAKGRPCSNYYGGEMSVMLESTDSIQLFQQMIRKDMPTVDGSIEVLSGSDEVCVKRIDFKEAYIYSYGEQMQSASPLPMTTTIMISPMRLDFNNLLRLDRLWPRAKHGWQKFVEEEGKRTTQPIINEEVQEAECTVTFRRCKDYDGSFGFDWLRTGDSGEAYKGDSWYKDIMPLPGQYDELVSREYLSFDQEWRKNNIEYKNNYRYVVPWALLMNGSSAKFRIKLEVNKPSGQLTIKIKGSGYKCLKTDLQEIDATKVGSYYNTKNLTVTCNGTFDSTTYIEIYAKDILVGKLAFAPNNKTYPIDILLIPVKVTGANIPDVSSYCLNISKYLKQAYITTNISLLESALDLTKGSMVKVNTIGKGKENRVVFDAYFRGNSDKKINTREGLKTYKNAPDGLGGLELYPFLDEMLCRQFPKMKPKLSHTYRLYFFAADATAGGQAENIGGSFAAAIFNGTGQATPTHEILHCLGLRHVFDEKNKYLFNKYYTDNLMDYAPHEIDFRNSLFYWQIKQLWNILKQ